MATQDSFLHGILELAVDIELACAGVYEVFGKQFSDRDDLALFWRLYAEAERYHAASIRIHQETFGQGDEVEGDRFEEEAAQSRKFLEQLRGWTQRFEKEKPSIDEAFSIAEFIEEHTAELHGRTQFFKVYPAFEPIFRQITEEDQDHRDMLTQAAQRFTGA